MLLEQQNADPFLMAASVFCSSENSDFFVFKKMEKVRPTAEEDMKEIEFAALELYLGAWKRILRTCGADESI